MHPVDIINLVLATCAVTGSAFFALASAGWRRARFREKELLERDPDARRSQESFDHHDAAPPDITVIIAAHDEEARMPALIAALEAQTYPREHMRVIIADDRSDDRTAHAAQAGTLPVHVVRIDDVPAGVSPKKHALNAAIRYSDTEFLIFTDADCRPESGWIAGMARRLAAGDDVVIGLSPADEARGSAARFVAYDTARTALLTIAAAGWDLPYMAVGRCWGYRRSAYDRVGGLAPHFHHLSGDDDLLLQRFAREGLRIGTCTERGTHCPTPPPRGWRAAVRMKLRHFSVATAYRGRASVLLGVLVAAQFLAVGAAPVWLVCTGVHPLIVLALLTAKLAYDTQFIAPALPGHMRTRGTMGRASLIVLEYMHVVSSVILGTIAAFRRPRW